MRLTPPFGRAHISRMKKTTLPRRGIGRSSRGHGPSRNPPTRTPPTSTGCRSAAPSATTSPAAARPRDVVALAAEDRGLLRRPAGRRDARELAPRRRDGRARPRDRRARRSPRTPTARSAAPSSLTASSAPRCWPDTSIYSCTRSAASHPTAPMLWGWLLASQRTTPDRCDSALNPINHLKS